MAGSVNKVILVGNLGRDPEIRHTQEGSPIVHLNVATSETWKDRQSFIDWTQSEAFAKGHRQGSVAGVLEGPPVIGLYEAVLVETA